MIALSAVLGRQLREPAGIGGWLIAQAMRLANRRALALSLQALGVRAGDAVIDLGCGAGDALLPLRLAAGPTGQVYAFDHAVAMVAAARRRHPGVCVTRGDFATLPLPDGSIDRILALNVAYFWSNDRRVLTEIRRVLKPGGRLVVYVTDGDALRRIGLDRTGTHRMIDRLGLTAMLGPEARIEGVKAGPGVRGWIGLLDMPAGNADGPLRRCG